jgi:hypothetical protein
MPFSIVRYGCNMLDFEQFYKFEINDISRYLTEDDDYEFYRQNYTDAETGEKKITHATSGVLRQVLNCIYSSEKNIRRIRRHIENEKFENQNGIGYDVDSLNPVIMRMLFHKILVEIVGNNNKIILSSSELSSVAIKAIEHNLYTGFAR